MGALIQGTYMDKKEFGEKLSMQLHQHRVKLGYAQSDVAELLGISESSYQRWESKGEGLTDIHKILAVLKVLHFSTPETIRLLELPELKMDEVKELCQDKETLERIKGQSVLSYMRENWHSMGKVTLKKLFFIILDGIYPD